MKNHLRNLGLLLLVTLLVISAGFLLFNRLYNQTYLPPELAPTAEYFLKSAANPPNWMRINPPPNGVLHKEKPIEISLLMCSEMFGLVGCDSPLHVADDSYQLMALYRQWSNLYINGQKSSTLLYMGGGNMTGTGSSGTLTMYINPLLLTGYHLFKFEPANSPEAQNNPDPKLTYEWAYRVE